ncbi:MAG: FecR domain-containing protein [Gemmatimonadota bacterium]
MDELIIQVLERNAPPEVAERVRAWRAESEANEAYFRDTARVWALTEPATATADSQPANAAVVAAAAEVRRARTDEPAVIALDQRRRRPRFGGRALRWSVALAAAIAAVALGIRLDMFGGGRSSTSYIADTGASRVITLQDGSLVKLAPASRLRTAFSASERGVTLQGRAFFAVAHDAARPFIVRAGGADTRVLGTRFEVAQTDSGVRAIVVEGVVALSNKKGSVDVPAGSLGQATGGRAPTVRRTDDVYAYLDWPEGVMLFQATPLAEVARELERRFGRKVDVLGNVGTIRISGTLEENSFGDAVLTLCQIAGAHCELTEEGARIQP